MQTIDGGFWVLLVLSVLAGALVGLAVLSAVSLLLDWLTNRGRKRR